MKGKKHVYDTSSVLFGLSATLATGVAVEKLNAAGNTDEKAANVSALWDKKESGWSENDLQDEKLLMDSYFPTLVQNEKERLAFYRDCRNKVTVGYGTNVQDNPAALSDVPIFGTEESYLIRKRKLL